MYAIFMDESGYSSNWQSDMEKQPYYVLAAICLPCDNLVSVYDAIRKKIHDLGLKIKGAKEPLGLGFEIKASDIARGAGYWRRNNRKRNVVRNTMLSAPAQYGGTAFVAIIDKAAHKNRYTNPADPCRLSFEFICERLQHFLTDVNNYGIIIYDQNKRYEHTLQNDAASLVRNGSLLLYQSRYLQTMVMKQFRISRVIEFTTGNSKNSVGLQIADFYATSTYRYFKSKKPVHCGWWRTLRSSLYRKGNKLYGVGCKIFP